MNDDSIDVIYFVILKGNLRVIINDNDYYIISAKS